MNTVKTYSMLSLGDSYTIGEQVSASERFPDQTAILLEKDGIHIDPIKIIATTGWTTDELNKAIQSEQLQGTYNLVTLLIGVNNQYRNRDEENYRIEFIELLEKANSFAGNKPGHIYVLSIPDWGVTPFAAGRDRQKIAAEIDTFNAINRKATMAFGAHYLDITGISRESVHDSGLLTGDGLHPSGKMYGLWAKKLADLIGENL